MSTITVKLISQYGNERIFPICERATLFTELIGQRSFTLKDLKLIKQLGFKVEVEQPTIKEL